MVSRAGVAAGEKACALVWACRARGVGERGTGASAYAREAAAASARWVVTESVHGPRVRVGSAAGGWAEVVFWGGPSRRRFAWGRRLEDVRTPLAVAGGGLCSWGASSPAAHRARSGPSVERLVRPVRTGTPARAPRGDERAGRRRRRSPAAPSGTAAHLVAGRSRVAEPCAGAAEGSDTRHA